MAGSWPGTSGLQLLLLHLVLLAVAPPSRAQSADEEWQRRILERRQVEQLPPAAMPEPSCTQLRLMWRQMHRMARHSQLTNEIPQFPASYPFGYVSPDDKALMYWTPASFGKVVRQPGQKPVSSIKPGRPSLNGRFAQTPLPRSALGSSYGTVVRSPSEKAALRRQMAAATGAWGPFPPDRGSDAGVVSKTRVLYRSEQERCGRSVMGRTCHSHDDCFCPGLKFFCSAGRCRSPASRKEVVERALQGKGFKCLIKLTVSGIDTSEAETHMIPPSHDVTATSHAENSHIITESLSTIAS